MAPAPLSETGLWALVLGLGGGSHLVVWGVKWLAGMIRAARRGVADDQAEQQHKAAEERAAEKKLTDLKDQVADEMKNMLDLAIAGRDAALAKCNEMKGHIDVFKGQVDECQRDRAMLLAVKAELQGENERLKKEVKTNIAMIYTLEERLEELEKKSGIKRHRLRRPPTDE